MLHCDSLIIVCLFSSQAHPDQSFPYHSARQVQEDGWQSSPQNNTVLESLWDVSWNLFNELLT